MSSVHAGQRSLAPVLRWVALVLGAYAVFVIAVSLYQHTLIYFPDDRHFADCPGFAGDEQIAAEGTRAYFRRVSPRVLVFYHGNAGSACDRAPLAERFAAMGYSTLMVEYTGYAGDPRRPSEDALLRDARNIRAWLATEGLEHVVVGGESLGAAVAAYHASLGGADRLLLIAPFDELQSVGRHHYPFLPVSLFLRETYPAAEWANARPVPTMVVHGERDRIVPLSLGEQLFSLLRSEHKTLTVIAGADHNDLYAFPDMWVAITTFLAAPGREV